MPLASIVGITNTGLTLPLAYAFLTSKSAVSFKFLAEQLTSYVFFDCGEPAVIVADLAKGLGAAIAGLANHVYGGEVGGWVVDTELPDADSLQYCEWHASEAIKRRLIKAGKYNQEKRDELMKLVIEWICSLSLKALKKRREALLSKLQAEERRYLIEQYQGIESHFIRAYTHTYRNLGVNFTQHNEGYHVITKQRLLQHLRVMRSVEIIAQEVLLLKEKHMRGLDENRDTRPRRLDTTVFGGVADYVTNYALKKLNSE